MTGHQLIRRLQTLSEADLERELEFVFDQQREHTFVDVLSIGRATADDLDHSKDPDTTADAVVVRVG